MSGLEISNLVDLIVLALLAGTIFYAMRLSEQLNILKDSKNELEQLVSNLSINIRRAHEAIQEMQEVATKSGDDLQELIIQGQSLSSELQIINESSNNLANRLENGIETITDKPQPTPHDLIDDYSDTYFDADGFTDYENNDNKNIKFTQSHTKHRVKHQRKAPKQVDDFFIRDREFDTEFEDELNDYDDYEDEFQNLSSRAEKQLASAIRRNRKFDA